MKVGFWGFFLTILLFIFKERLSLILKLTKISFGQVNGARGKKLECVQKFGIRNSRNYVLNSSYSYNTDSYFGQIVLCLTKGQLISKCLFGVFTFFQKTKKNKSTSSKVEFVRSFFGRNVGLKKSFRICLPIRKLKFWRKKRYSFWPKHDNYFKPNWQKPDC